jgi:hypothetical protein
MDIVTPSHIFPVFHHDRQYFKTALLKREHLKEYLLGISWEEGEMAKLVMCDSIL